MRALLLLSFFLFCFCEKKYVLIATASPKGHLFPMIELAKALEETGKYEILVVSEPNAQEYVTSQGLNFSATDINADFQPPSEPINGLLDVIERQKRIGDILGRYSVSLWHKLTQEIKQRRPDIIIYEFFAFSAGDIANKFNIPGLHIVQGITSGFKTDWDHLSLNSFMHLTRRSDNRLSELTFFERFRNFFKNQFDFLLSTFWLRAMNKHRASIGLEPYNSFADWIMLKAKHRIISLTSFPLDTPRAILPMITHAGPILHKTSLADLSKIEEGLREWLRTNIVEGEQGTILLYVSFGSVWSPEHPEMEKLLRIFNHLREYYKNQARPFFVLWARGRELLAYRGLGSNYTDYFTNKKELENWLRLEKFVPQKQIFYYSGKNITAYVTHCGINSVVEGLSSGVPLFGLPLMADQFSVASRLTEAQLGDAANIVTETEEEVIQQLKELIASEAESRRNLELMKRMFEFDGGFEKVERIISFMIETNEVNVAHLMPFDTDWPFWKKRSLDVILLLTVAFGFGVLVPIVLLRLLWKFLRYLCGSNASSGGKKKKE